jgi:putative membrane protein
MEKKAGSAMLCIAMLAVIGCADADTEDDAAVQDTAAQTAPAPAAAAAPSDPEIAHIVVTANTIDIEAGQLAKGKAANREVKAFAEQMITDHTGVNKLATDLAKRLNVTPADNSTSQSLKSSANEATQSLQGKTGAEFDRAYMEREVAFHQQVLDALDQTLIPGAQNAELKALLEQTRPAIAGHLEMARALQTKLSQ